MTRLGVLCLLLIFVPAAAEQNKTVIGPTNPDLKQGAEALLAKDAEKGVRLTLIGLAHASNKRERVAALSNLCAGYIMLEEIDVALSYCDRALDVDDEHWRAYCNRALAYIKIGRFDEAELDLQEAEALRPNARKVKIVRSMLLNETNPVVPTIVIDDRRQPVDDLDD